MPEPYKGPLELEGRVRGVTLGQTRQGNEFARIKLAGCVEYLMDFDAAQEWPDLLGQLVSVTCHETVGYDGFTYLVVDDSVLTE